MVEIGVCSALTDYEEPAMEAGADIFILKGTEHDDLWNWLEQLGSGLEIVIVDDDSLTVELLSRSLERKGHTVHGFTDSEQVLDRITKLNPDAVGVSI